MMVSKTSLGLLACIAALGLPQAASVSESRFSETSMPTASRSLLQSEKETEALAPANVTFVDTPQGLLAAVRGGALDIVIVDHLDLTTLPLRPTSICDVGCESPLGEITATRSIRGRCVTQPNAANFPGMNGIDLVPTTTGQCFLLTHDDMLGIVGAKFWADNLYLRAALPYPNPRLFHFPALAVIPPLATGGSAGVYLTNMIFQGDGEGSVVGVGVDDKVFISDSLFTSLGGARELACTECSSGIEARAAVSVRNSMFEKLITEPGSRYIRAYKGGAVRLENNTYEAATKAFEVQDTGDDKADGFYSDMTGLLLELTEENFTTRAASPLTDIPEEDPEDPGNSLFLSADDAWFVAVQKALGETPIASGSSANDSDNSNTAIIAAVVATVLMLLALGALALFVIRRRRKQQQQDSTKDQKNNAQYRAYMGTHGQQHQHTQGGSPQDPRLRQAVPNGWNQSESIYSYTDGITSINNTRGSTEGSVVGGASNVTPLRVDSHPAQGSVTPQGLSSMQSGSQSNFWSSQHKGHFVTVNAGSTTRNGPSTFDTLTIPTTTAPGPPPTKSAGDGKLIDFLHEQLDSMGDRTLLDRFVLSGPAQRRQGGQGVVAFATGARDGLDYAIKFFLHRPSFLSERALYDSHTLGKLLPQIEGTYDPEEFSESQALVDRGGNKLPPFLVMEKGESLIDWSKRNRSDVFQAVAVLAHVGMRLKDLHAAGMCHRDIKPGNIMLLHRKNRWTLIDFGCVANIGQPAGLSFTLHYAAPEAVEAWHNEEKKIIADGALDAWALGVVAFELLTRKQAFQLIIQSKQEVVSQLRGESDLPWEGERLSKVERKLGKMRGPVLALLNRDPAQRMTAAQFVRECNSLFAVDTVEYHQDGFATTIL